MAESARLLEKTTNCSSVVIFDSDEVEESYFGGIDGLQTMKRKGNMRKKIRLVNHSESFGGEMEMFGALFKDGDKSQRGPIE